MEGKYFQQLPTTKFFRRDTNSKSGPQHYFPSPTIWSGRKFFLLRQGGGGCGGGGIGPGHKCGRAAGPRPTENKQTNVHTS